MNNEVLFNALDRLAGEVRACWSMDEADLRSVLGNTNYQAVQEQIDRAVSLLRAPYCCHVDCGPGHPAEFEIAGKSGHPEDFTHACSRHVGELLGTPDWLDSDNDQWVVTWIGGGAPGAVEEMEG